MWTEIFFITPSVCMGNYFLKFVFKTTPVHVDRAQISCSLMPLVSKVKSDLYRMFLGTMPWEALSQALSCEKKT